MHSSTSNSENQGFSTSTRCLVLFLLAILVQGLAIECFTRFVFERRSKIQNRVNSEYNALFEPDMLTKKSNSLLFVGNSLLLEGLQLDVLRQALAPAYNVKRFVVEDTSFYDWYFGLSRILRHGSAPKEVVVSLIPSQLISDRVRGEYFAHYLLDYPDFFSLSQKVGIDKNKLGSFLFAKISTFYAIRVEIRKWLINLLIPDFGALTTMILKAPPVSADSKDLLERAKLRLAELKALGDKYGSTIILAIPPQFGPRNQAEFDIVSQAGREVGVQVLVAIAPMDIPKSAFSDGFHLNQQGAKAYTEALIRTILSPTPSP